MSCAKKSPGREAYEFAVLADEPHIDAETLERFWTNYLTDRCRDKWEAVAAQIREPLLKKISDLATHVSRLSSMRRNCDVCHKNFACHKEQYSIGVIYSCNECWEKEIEARTREECQRSETP